MKKTTVPDQARGDATAWVRLPAGWLCAVLLALWPGLASSAHGSRLFQAAPWKVTRVEPADGSARFCRATAPMAVSIGGVALFDASFEARPDGSCTLTEHKAEPVPEWMFYDKGRTSGEEVKEGCRFWFDDRAMWPMRSVWDLATGTIRYDLGGDRQLLEELAAARYLKLETSPGSVTEVNGERRFSGDNFSEYSLVNAAGMVRDLTACLASINEPGPFVPTTAYEATPPAPPLPAPMSARLDAARQACRLAPADDADARAMALLRLGLTAADALRLGEAREAFAGLQAQLAQGASPTPAIRRGLARFVESLVQAERFDEAFAVARTLPENEPLLAAIDLSRGDYPGAEKWLCAAASRILGRPVEHWSALARMSAQDFRMELWGGMAPAMRHLLLLWATCALGQEKALITAHCGNCVFPMQSATPAVAAANQVGNWLEGNMAREGASDTPAARRDLGLAAFLRGASLLRAGYLLTVQSELTYALFELGGAPGAEGLAARARVALAGLSAAQGRSFEALQAVREAAAAIGNTLGRESLPWIESAALESETALRAGDPAAAEAKAREGLAAAETCLPAEHSLVYRLKRCLGQALLEQGKVAQAGQVLMAALGLDRVPAVADDRLRALLRQLAAIPSPSLTKQPIVPTNDAELRQMQQDTEKNRVALGTYARARYEILGHALALPSLSGKLSVAARVERIQYGGPLFLLQGKFQKTPQAAGLALLREALGFDEQRTEYRLEGSDVGGGLSFADRLAAITRGESLLDNHRPIPAGQSPYLMAQILAPTLYMAALDWMSLTGMFPGEKRQSLLPGEATEGLERMFQETRGLWQSLEPAKGLIQLQGVLVQTQAATRGEVLGNLLTRAQLVEDPGLPQEYRHYSQQAIDGELWLRRQRGMLLDTISLKDPATPRISHARALARRLALSLPYDGTGVASKFSYYQFGDLRTAQKSFETLTWFGSAKYEFKLDKAQALLKPDEAMVVWLPLERITHIFVIRNKECHWETVPVGQAGIAGHVRAIRQSIEAVVPQLGKDPGGIGSDAFPADDAYALYKALFAPVAASLAGVDHLYAVQLGATGGVPLGLLVTRPPARDREPDWLIDRFAITRVPALVNPEALRHNRPANLPARTLLAAGDPLVGKPSQEAPGPAFASLRSVSNIDGVLAPLPESRREMESVARLLGLSPSETEQSVFSGERATPQRILDQLRQHRFKYLLFATHGLFRFEDVGEPALVLSPTSGKRRPGDDGLLRTSEIVGLDLDTDLVILSACETSPSGEDGAEPLTGLASAFLVAGARAVVSTQWAVLSKAAESVSTAMIAAMRSGRDPARALQQAVHELRASGRSTHPAYWAPYELVAFPR